MRAKTFYFLFIIMFLVPTTLAINTTQIIIENVNKIHMQIINCDRIEHLY